MPDLLKIDRANPIEDTKRRETSRRSLFCRLCRLDSRRFLAISVSGESREKGINEHDCTSGIPLRGLSLSLSFSLSLDDSTRSAYVSSPSPVIPDPVDPDHPFAVPAITQRVFFVGTRFIVYFRFCFLAPSNLQIDRLLLMHSVYVYVRVCVCKKHF